MRKAIVQMPLVFSPLPSYESLPPNLTSLLTVLKFHVKFIAFLLHPIMLFITICIHFVPTGSRRITMSSLPIITSLRRVIMRQLYIILSSRWVVLSSPHSIKGSRQVVERQLCINMSLLSIIMSSRRVVLGSQHSIKGLRHIVMRQLWSISYESGFFTPRLLSKYLFFNH